MRSLWGPRGVILMRVRGRPVASLERDDALWARGVRGYPVARPGSESGLGVMMVQAAGRYQVDVVFSGLIVFAALSLAMSAMVQVLENRLSLWRPQRAGGE